MCNQKDDIQSSIKISQLLGLIPSISTLEHVKNILIQKVFKKHKISEIGFNIDIYNLVPCTSSVIYTDYLLNVNNCIL